MNSFDFKPIICKKCGTVVWSGISWAGFARLLDNAELATQLAETERKQDILVKILKEVTATCPKCKLEVAKRLSQITGIVEPVVIDTEESSGS